MFLSYPLVSQDDNRRIEYYRGDWPPKGARIRWVAGILEYGDRVALVCVTGRGWFWPAADLAAGEIPWDALERAASLQSGSPIAWARPVAVMTIRDEGDGPGEVLQLFAGQLSGEPAQPPDPLIEHVDLVPYDEARDVLNILVGDTPVVATHHIIDDLVEAAQEEIQAGPGEAAVTEARHHVFSPPTFYHCRLVAREAEGVVLEYRGKRAGRLKGIEVPVGSRTIARYTPGARYVPWQVYGPSNERLCTVIHVADRVEVGADRVSYRDLLVDVFIDSAGRVSIVDQDDLERALQEGLLDTELCHSVMAAAQEAAADPAAILAGLPVC